MMTVYLGIKTNGNIFNTIAVKNIMFTVEKIKSIGYNKFIQKNKKRTNEYDKVQMKFLLNTQDKNLQKTNMYERKI